MEREAITVQCYSGYKGDERPVSFTLAGETFRVTEVLDRWYDLDANYFKVQVENGAVHLLRQDLDSGEWELLK